MKTQKLARERQIQVEERMKNEEKRHAQALRRVLREKREKEREIAVMKQLMKTRDRERGGGIQNAPSFRYSADC